MPGLRKRISNLFLQFIQTPEFNPESIAHQKVCLFCRSKLYKCLKQSLQFPDAGQSWKRDQAVYFCRGCTKYLSSTAFYLSTTMKHLGKCKACTMNENIAITRKDDTEYTQMFRTIKLQEEMKRQKTGVPEDPHYNAMALLQESDIRYLVDVIWNHQSVISATKEELIMTRWDPLMEISPWNCILLTQPEAATHDKQRSPLDLYSDEFQAKIAQKHLAARQHFTRLPAIERLIRKNYEEGPAGALMPRQSEEVAV